MSIVDDVTQVLTLAGYSVKPMSLPSAEPGLTLQALKGTATGISARTITCVTDPAQANLVVRSSGLIRASWVVVPDQTDLSVPPGLARRLEGRKVEVFPLTFFFDRILRAQEICQKTLATTVPWKNEIINLERLASLYIPQRAKVSRNSHDETVDDSRSLFSSMLSGTSGGVTLILADAGHGKTWLTWSLAHDAAIKYLEAVAKPHEPHLALPPVPFLIPFSQYKRLTSFDGIVLERLNALGTLDIKAEGFKYLLSRGRIVLILDGFDEMLELAPTHARENLLEIRRHLKGFSKLVLTSRRTIFPTRAEIAAFMGLSGTEADDLELSICYLQGFTPDQVRAFYLTRGASESEVSDIRRLPIDNELRRSPQMAEYFFDIVRDRGAAGKEVPSTTREVFDTVLSLIFRRESEKWEKEGNPPMNRDLQEDFLTEIALAMWPKGSESPDVVQLEADLMGHRYLAKHHLLQPTLDGQFQFEHHVWRDWFMTRAVLNRVEKANWSLRTLSNLLGDPLPEYCVALLAERAPLDRLETSLKDTSLSDAAFSNLLRVAIARIPTGISPSDRTSHLIQYIGSRQALQHRSLARVRFELFDFRDWKFDGTTFDQTTIGFSVLPSEYEQHLRHTRGIQLIDCTWFPELGPDLVKAREQVRSVLARFVMSTEPLRVRDRIATDEMDRKFHVPSDNEALKCLMKGSYIRLELEAASERVYVLDRKRLDELIKFMQRGVGLDDVVHGVAK